MPASTPRAVQAAAASALPWWQRTLAVGLVGSLLLFAALPPLNLWPLAWVAPVPWLLLARRESLPGKRPYRALWLAGFVFWLLAVHWLRYPHPATHLGWLALSFYLAFYLPVFVGLVRVAIWQFRVPIIVAAPVVWTGLELARSHLLTGFMMAGLGHTQYRWTDLIQISDLAGAYGVSFLVMLVAACLARIWPFASTTGRDRLTPWPLAVIAAALGATLWYGSYRTSEEPRRDGPRVALIQGSIAADWKQDPDKETRIFREYLDLTTQAVAAARNDGKPVDLVVWPETMYRRPVIEIAEGYVDPLDSPYRARDAAASAEDELAAMAKHIGAPLLFGIEAIKLRPEGEQYFNAAVAVDGAGKIIGRYDKMHRVMFGEYVPFAEYFPWLYRLTPLGGGLAAGAAPRAAEIGGVRYAPNVCFETVIPQVIRRHVCELAEQGEEPDVLVNVTNDAWFRGSSELEMHLACGVFRAVECRKPLVIAANGGTSASIDSSGRVRSKLEPLATGHLLADVELDGRVSPYLRGGDWPAGLCLTVVIGLAIGGGWRRRQSKSKSDAGFPSP